MNGYEIMAASYRQMVKQGRIDKETADKEIRIYDFLATCDTEDICRMVDSSAFNDIIKAFVETAVKNADIDGFTDNTAKEIVIRTDNVNNVGDFDFLQKKQLRHEIIHAFLSESGLQCNWQHMEQFGQDETTVDWFAIQSPKIFEVFKELELI